MSQQQLPTPRRLVIGAGAHAELAKRIRALRPDLEIRGNVYTAITSDDLEWADTYMGFRRPPLPPTMGSVRWVHCTGAGVDSWLYPNELPRDILLTRTSESFGVYIAEWALSRALAFRQQILDLADCQRRHEWAPRDIGYVRGSRAIVVGTGDVGGHIARLFSALGAECVGVSRSGRGGGEFAATHAVSALQRLVGNADWLIVALPLTSDSRGLIGRDILSACRGAVLMNAGRGAVIDESLIPEALDRGWISGALLDVFETEPLPKESPLWDDKRVMISPHISGLTTPEGAVDGFIECLEEIEAGRVPARAVDREHQY